MLARIAASVALAAICAAPVGAEENLFPFVVSYDSPENATNVAHWLERPAGKHGFVRAERGGLCTDAGPIHFWATNLCFEGCFPTHDEAERLAARLARLGINCVRMHHMDSYSIWGDSPNKLTIDPKKIERLDYLVFQLKEHGVYTNLNLHVSRWFGAAEGFPDREKRPNYDKGLDNFEPRMIELQKKYARDLLSHVNPYTKTAYAQEPAVAFVEINNENALYAEWNWGNLDKLPEPYAGTFRKRWNEWLTKKYSTTEKLRKAWNAEAVPLGQEMLTSGDFAKSIGRPWNLERDDASQAEWSIHKGPAGQGMLRLEVRRAGKIAWHPQFSHSGLAVKKDTPYTLTFEMRADKAQKVSINGKQAHEPWEDLGFHTDVNLGSEWKPFRYTFVLSRDDENARIGFSGFPPGVYELARISLRPGGVMGLEANQRLEDGSVPVLGKGSMNLTRSARHDFLDFLWETEAAYWGGMGQYLKNELGVRALVAGTQMGWSPVHVQAALDFIDAHSYWHHPTFPGRPWDSRDWYVTNEALVNSPGGTLARLAATRVAGKPYTVSEYNHPAPISYAAEGFPMIAAYGALQGWDAIYSFAYSHNNRYEPRKFDGFFDIKCDPSRMVHMPACAAMFLRGDVAKARQTLTVPMSRQAERTKLHETQSAWTLTSTQFGLDANYALRHAIALDLRGEGSAAVERPKLGKEKVFVSDTGELRWDASQPGAGYFVADTPRTKLFTGFVRGRTIPLGSMTLKIGPTKLDWATVSITAVEGPSLDEAKRILIAATGWVQNKDAQFETLAENRITLRDRWGTEPILCEGIPIEVTLPAVPQRVHAYALDAAGNRREALKVAGRDRQATIQMGPAQQTLWYEVELK